MQVSALYYMMRNTDPILIALFACFVVSTLAEDANLVKSQAQYGYVEVRSGAHMFW